MMKAHFSLGLKMVTTQHVKCILVRVGFFSIFSTGLPWYISLVTDTFL